MACEFVRVLMRQTGCQISRSCHWDVLFDYFIDRKNVFPSSVFVGHH
jgi:hypothetical protein